ncbi:MAG: hypothetical protein KatS3mg114_0341 [Planctomycetaceae bacterium]|nr:MAG: hypothetical protein KatS3mg114_0341 [Planctomycetaceae bacterium]
MQQLLDYLQRERSRFEEELCAWLRYRSISADPQYRDELHQAAEWIHRHFLELGFSSRLVPTAGHPVVFAESPFDPAKLTVLVYGHYDVQPADPESLWHTPPFAPHIREGRVYARGASDDKGQCLTHVKSAEAWLKSFGYLPVNLKFVIEGEEEIGSVHLESFLAEHRAQLACDVAVVSDTAMYGPDQPAITRGLRGIAACEVTVYGPARDLHSGVFGGTVANPVTALARLLACLHDDSGRIAIPGFYDDVWPVSAAEKACWEQLPFDESAYLSSLGVAAAWGEAGYSTLERRWSRPTCEVNGFIGGYTGPGPKTIIPAQATAKITCRLVPQQQPERILQALERHLREHLLPGCRLEFVAHHGASAYLFPESSPYLEAARQALKLGFGVEPVLIREGGSIPIVTAFHRLLGVDTLLLGWGLNSDNLHSPNEHFSLRDYHRGIAASAWLWQTLSACRRQ